MKSSMVASSVGANIHEISSLCTSDNNSVQGTTEGKQEDKEDQVNRIITKYLGKPSGVGNFDYEKMFNKPRVSYTSNIDTSKNIVSGYLRQQKMITGAPVSMKQNMAEFYNAYMVGKKSQGVFDKKNNQLGSFNEQPLTSPRSRTLVTDESKTAYYSSDKMQNQEKEKKENKENYGLKLDHSPKSKEAFPLPGDYRKDPMRRSLDCIPKWGNQDNKEPILASQELLDKIKFTFSKVDKVPLSPFKPDYKLDIGAPNSATHIPAVRVGYSSSYDKNEVRYSPKHFTSPYMFEVFDKKGPNIDVKQSVDSVFEGEYHARNGYTPVKAVNKTLGDMPYILTTETDMKVSGNYSINSSVRKKERSVSFNLENDSEVKSCAGESRKTSKSILKNKYSSEVVPKFLELEKKYSLPTSHCNFGSKTFLKPSMSYDNRKIDNKKMISSSVNTFYRSTYLSSHCSLPKPCE